MQLYQDFFVFPEDLDLFRVGNSTHPRWNNVRLDEVETYEVNGVLMVRANNLGVSVYTEDRVKKSGLSGWAWRIKRGAVLPPTLKIWSDEDGHGLICPTVDMPLSKYVSLLEELVVHSVKEFKLEKV